jgi:hypothetical protein
MDYSWTTTGGELYETDLAKVDVSALKHILYHCTASGIPTVPFDLNEVVSFERKESTLWFRNGGHRTIKPERLAGADIRIPIIYGFLPGEIRPDGTVFWAHDVVDGFHRIAVAKERGEKFLPAVKIVPQFSILATNPLVGATGQMYRDSNVRAPAGYWEFLESKVGHGFGLSQPVILRQMKRVIEEYNRIMGG